MMCANDLQIPIHAAADDNVRTHFESKRLAAERCKTCVRSAAMVNARAGNSGASFQLFGNSGERRQRARAEKKGFSALNPKPHVECLRVSLSVFGQPRPNKTNQLLITYLGRQRLSR